jgi:Tn3 transposase DDE domain
LSLLANIVMAWNTAKMQAIFDRWAQRRSGAIPPELIARIAPTRSEGLNMRGIFSFPIEQYAAVLLPSGQPQKLMFWVSKSALAEPGNAHFEGQPKQI